MKLIDDPRLTAYALNEMTDAAERAAFEAALASDPIVLAEVDAIRATAGLLRGELHGELTAIAASRGDFAMAGVPMLAAPRDADLTPASLRRSIARHWTLAAAAAVIVGGVVTAAMVSSHTGGWRGQYAAHEQAVDRAQTVGGVAPTPPISIRFNSTNGGPTPAGFNVPTVPTTSSVLVPRSLQYSYQSVGTPLPATAAEMQNFGVMDERSDGRPKAIVESNVIGSVAVRADDSLLEAPAVETNSASVTLRPAAADPGVMSNVPLAATASASANGLVSEAEARFDPQATHQLSPAGAVATRTPNLTAGAVVTNAPAVTPVDGAIALPGGAARGGKDSKRARDLNYRYADPIDVASQDRAEWFARVQERGLQQADDQQSNTESYAGIHDNAFLTPTAAPLSTFGVDVDTASFANVRRYLTANTLPPADAVRIEELINYFPTSDAPPASSPDGKPFAVHTEVSECPWAQGHQLVRIALKGKVIDNEKRPPSNLVFLVDVSGSMNEPTKLPLVQRSLRKLVGQLGENDRVAMVVYAGNSGLVLESTSASDKTKILKAIDDLQAGGSTNGGEGIELAYKTATDAMVKNGTNRVILCTDGDFNVGITDRTALFDLIGQKAQAGVFLSVCGFGTGNTKDDTMEGLADKGNGQYAYIDTDREAEKVFVGQIGGTLVTIAKDVKLQLEFNPSTVKSYRLIGYENRVMAAQDFNNDLKDAGDIGAGHSVVALYEIEPIGTGATGGVPAADGLKYQKPVIHEVAADANTGELLTLKLRFKKPDAALEQGTSELIETTVENHVTPIGQASADFRFAASVAGFGMMLRESPHKASCTWDLVRGLASGSVGADAGGYRSEYLNLIDQASRLRR